MIYYIYKITNTINDKIYIGKTKRPERRMVEHMNHHSNRKTKFYNAVKKYGKDCFKMVILEEIIIDAERDGKIDLLEQEYIKKYDTVKNGYNSTYGGDGGNTYYGFTTGKINQIKEKHRVVAKKLWEDPEYRKKVLENQKIAMNTKEFKEKQSQILKKLWEDPENKKKQSNYLKKLWGDPKYRKKQSEISKIFCNTPEIKKLRSENATGTKNSRWRGFVYIIKKNGDIIDKYETFKSFSCNVKLTKIIRNEFHNGKNIIKYNNNFIFVSKKEYFSGPNGCEIPADIMEAMKSSITS